jgi:hypothetical protein
MLEGGKAERPWLGLTIAETMSGAQVVYVSPHTPAAEQLFAEGSTIASLAGKKFRAGGGTLIPALQDELFPRRVGELIEVKTTDGALRIIRLESRPQVPLADAAKMDTKERMAAPLFGIVLESAVGGAKMSQYLIKNIVRGSVGDEAGLSPADPISILKLRVEEKDGYALLDIYVKKRLAGYLETTMRLPALLDSPDTL